MLYLDSVLFKGIIARNNIVGTPFLRDLLFLGLWCLPMLSDLLGLSSNLRLTGLLALFGLLGLCGPLGLLGLCGLLRLSGLLGLGCQGFTLHWYVYEE